MATKTYKLLSSIQTSHDAPILERGTFQELDEDMVAANYWVERMIVEEQGVAQTHASAREDAEAKRKKAEELRAEALRLEQEATMSTGLPDTYVREIEVEKRRVEAAAAVTADDGPPMQERSAEEQAPQAAEKRAGTGRRTRGA